MTKAQAQALANEWIEAFNDHDLERILSHYADSMELDGDGRIARVLVHHRDP